MKRLRQRLDYLRESAPGFIEEAVSTSGAAHDSRIEALRRKLQAFSPGQLSKRKLKRAAVEKLSELPGENWETAYGQARVVRQCLAIDHHHGCVPVNAALAAEPQHLATVALDPLLGTIDVQRFLFIDTETTGLMGGTGTVPFLIGMAWFESGVMVLRQALLPRPGEEQPMLGLLAERLSQASCIVTYNGKSFDWPLLRTRFVMNRIAPPPLPPHLDLLHCSRRIFRRTLDDVRLISVEERVLGFERCDDLPGELIPQRYFDYLRGGDAAGLLPIIEHNANDLIALAAIVGVLAQRVGQAPEELAPKEALCLSELAVRHGDVERALALAEHAARSTRDDAIALLSLRLGALLLKRSGRYSEAAMCLHEALPFAVDDRCIAAQLHLVLAKLYEHKLGDAAAALKHAHASQLAEEPYAHDVRIRRLEKRLKL
ncbi:MAG: ribonuclease H-like domain-containing protein [Myxococcota bacterium]